jgi:protein tyrosine/serine phosphatase
LPRLRSRSRSSSLPLQPAALPTGKGRKTETVSVETCNINNFGKVNEYLFRGAQPEEEEYAQLATLGVKTVLDLRDDPKGYAKAQAEAAGLRYINLPMSDKKYPAEENVKKFLDLATDQGNWPLYVHCAGGRHRTGVMTAVYRMTLEGWDIERAYDEMKDYDFYTRWGHKAMKTFIFDYWKDLQSRRARPASAETQSNALNLNK